MAISNVTTQPAVVQTFNSAYPFDFKIQNQFQHKDDSVLYIVSNADPADSAQQLNLVITKNDNQIYVLKGFGDKYSNAGENLYNLALIFRPGTLKTSVQAGFGSVLQAAIETATKSKVKVSDPQNRPLDGAVVWYCAFQDDVSIRDAEDAASLLNFKLSGISAEAGSGSRSTQVELSLANVFIGGSGNPLTFTRSAHLDIVNHQGSTYAPMYFGVLGHNTLLNQPALDNSLTLYFETIGSQPLDFGPNTQIEFSFHSSDPTSGADPDLMYFGGSDEVKTYTLDEMLPSMEGDIGKITDKKLADHQGVTSQTFKFSSIKLSGPDGIVMLEVAIRNVPGYWDTDFQVPIVKATTTTKAEIEIGSTDSQGHTPKYSEVEKYGSRIDFLSGGTDPDNDTLAKVSIEEHDGLHLYGNSDQPVTVHTNLLVNGNVNIGATDSYSKLSVIGNAQTSAESGNADLCVGDRNGKHLSFQGGNDRQQLLMIAAFNGDRQDLLFLNYWGGGGIYLTGGDPEAKVSVGTTDFSEKFNVAGNAKISGDLYAFGKVGIGANDPKAKLHVNSPTGAAQLIIGNTDDAAVDDEIQFRSGYSGLANENDITASIIGAPDNGWGGRLVFNTSELDGILTEQMRIDSAGNIGIGTIPTTGNKLEVNGAAEITGALTVGADVSMGAASELFFSDQGQIRSTDNNHRILFRRSENTLELREYGQIVFSPGASSGEATSQVVMLPNGNVGIGTTNPTKAKLEIDGWVNTANNNMGAAFDRHAVQDYSGGSGAQNKEVSLSLYCTGAVVCLFLGAFSDARIKNIQGRSDGAVDLATLSRIEITDYTYKDVITKDTRQHKKVIGQQVESVYPQAVRRSTDVVPDIYQKANVKDGWIKLVTNLVKGERVRLIGEKKEGIHEVLEVAQDSFRTDFEADSDAVFVYGREVNDFLSVDYDAIAMLNVSATQQIKKEKDAEVKALQAENANLRDRLTGQEKRVSELETMYMKFETLFTRLQENAPVAAASPA